jgi:hypothetical protein
MSSACCEAVPLDQGDEPSQLSSARAPCDRVVAYRRGAWHHPFQGLRTGLVLVRMRAVETCGRATPDGPRFRTAFFGPRGWTSIRLTSTCAAIRSKAALNVLGVRFWYWRQASLGTAIILRIFTDAVAGWYRERQADPSTCRLPSGFPGSALHPGCRSRRPSFGEQPARALLPDVAIGFSGSGLLLLGRERRRGQKLQNVVEDEDLHLGLGLLLLRPLV